MQLADIMQLPMKTAIFSSFDDTSIKTIESFMCWILIANCSMHYLHNMSILCTYNIVVRARKRLGTLFQYMRFETKYAHPSFHSSPVHPYVVIVLGTKQRWKFIYNIPIVYFLRLIYRYLQYEQVNNIVPVIHILKKQE